MRFEKKIGIIICTALGALALTGCFSLAGDVTPPPNYVAPTVLPTNPAGGQISMENDLGATPQATDQTVVYPLVPPDPLQGATLYAERCAPCHGDQGMGNGSQADQLPNPPPAIGNATTARASRPVDWYNVITKGNMQQSMPPFGQSLSDRQRWDVLAYVYTLSLSDVDMQQAQALYEANCAGCHSTSGVSDGSQTASLSAGPDAWSNKQAQLAQMSEDDIVNLIETGQGEMPSFQGKLTPSQGYQLAGYVRSLSFASQTSAQPAAAEDTPVAGAITATAQTGIASAVTAAPTEATTAVPTGAATVTIKGQVTNGTPGGKVPSGLKLTLSLYNGMSLDTTLETEAAADGSYTFKNVKLDPNEVYFISVDALGATFNSDILQGTDITGAEAILPVKIYEPSTDASPLLVDRLHVFFDFSTQGVVQVVNLYIISNPSDHVIVASATGQPVISFKLPKDATNLQFQDGALGDGRYVQTKDGFGDTISIPPGTSSHQVLFAYNLPYTNKASLAVESPLPVNAVIVMIPPGVTLNSSQLSDAGQQDVQGTSFHMYQSKASLKAGEALNLALSGTPSDSATTSQPQINYLLVGLGVFGVTLVGVGVWMYLNQTRRAVAPENSLGSALDPGSDEIPPEESSEALLDAIVALDDLHASGQLPDAAYQDRRAALKARLADALGREKNS